MLRKNAEALSPHVRVFLKSAFSKLTTRARAFSISPNEKTLMQVGTAASAFFNTLNIDDPRPVLMCSEDLSGHMPGRHGLECYDSASLIMKSIADAARARFDAPDLTFYFSVRERDRWMRSTWWQNLRSTRLTRDLDQYKDQFAEACSLGDILAEIAQDVAPACVSSHRLEDCAGLSHGPLTPLLDLLDCGRLDRDALIVLPPENVQPDMGIDSVFLALNRSGLPDSDVRDAKRNIRKMAQRASR
nr:hypothetical protein [Marivita sp. GX14005]